MERVERSAGGVLVRHGMVLLVHQSETDTWAFPKGHVQPRETTVDAAVREIREEGGIVDLRLVGELGTYERGTHRSSGIAKSITMFLFETSVVRAVPMSADVTECRWCTWAEAMEVLSYPEDRAFLAAHLPTIYDLLSSEHKDAQEASRHGR